jgi:hypothetical protein
VKKATALTVAERGRTDPVWWVSEVLGDRPWAKQREILEAVRDEREVNVRSCHSAGKSWVASRAALWFLYNHPDSLVITTAPTARQVRGILWKEIRLAHARSRVPLGGDLSMAGLRLGPAWQALGFTAAEHDPERFQGFHAKSTMVIVDEACGVSAEIDTAVDSILSGEHVRLLRIGNPTNISTPFGEAFRQMRGRRFAISAFDTPNFTSHGLKIEDLKEAKPGEWDFAGSLPHPTLVSPQWVLEKFRQWGGTSGLFQARILAEFPSGADTSLVALGEIERAISRQPERTGQPVFGVDVARHGRDETVVAMVTGDKVEILAAWNGVDTMATVGRVIDLARKFQPIRIHVDEIGLGAGVLDRLMELGHPVVGVNVATAARDRDRFENLRAELFWNVREMITDGTLVLPEDDELVEQLAAIQYEFTSRGRIKIESKAAMTHSPDRADAVALALAPLPSSAYEPITIPDVGMRASPWQL